MRRGDFCAASEEVVEEEDRVGDAYHAVVVDIGGFTTGEGRFATEEATEESDGVGEGDAAIAVDIAAKELALVR